MRGGEKTLSALAGMFPEAPIYTLLANRDALDATLQSRDVRTSPLQWLNWIPNLQRKALPLLARAARSLDATAYDMVICSDAAIVKAIRTRPGALKICYCHSPMRYVWDLYDEYRRCSGPLASLGLRLAAPGLRRADRAAAQTVDLFVANSRHVADRIRRHYGRPSLVIPPPVDVSFPMWDRLPAGQDRQDAGPTQDKLHDFYLVVSELVHYKRVDLAVDACTRLNRPLVVIGTGPMLADLRRRAGACVRLLGWGSDAVVRDHYQRCRALLFCGEEDFGLTPVEAMAAGRPVIAYRAGGATETVLEHRTGEFFDAPTADSLIAAIQTFEQNGVANAPAEIQAHARQFSESNFRRRFLAIHAWCMAHYRSGGAAQVRSALATPSGMQALTAVLDAVSPHDSASP